MKRSMLTFLPCLWMLAPLAGAEGIAAKEFDSLTLTDGRKLEKVEVLKVEPDGLRVTHKDGAGKIGLELLPDAVVKQFNLSPEKAAEWRTAETVRLDEIALQERQAAVRKVIETSRGEQEDEVRRQRMDLYAALRSGNFNYVTADEDLRNSIALYKEAGREDLAALLEEDRQLLKQSEIFRPSADLEAQKQELANRVGQLEQDLQNAINQPPQVIVQESDPIFLPTNIYYPTINPWVPQPDTRPPHVRPPNVRPPAVKPPWVRPPGTVQPPVLLPEVPPIVIRPGAGPRQPGNGPSVVPQPSNRQPGTRQPSVRPPAAVQPGVRPPAVVQPGVRPPEGGNVPNIRPSPARPFHPPQVQPQAPPVRPAPEARPYQPPQPAPSPQPAPAVNDPPIPSPQTAPPYPGRQPR